MPTNKLKFDLIVIGSGVLGSFFAFHAVRLGKSVLVLEKDSAPQGATTRNFGQIVPSGMDRTWQRIGRESIRIYNQLQQETELSIRNLGSIYLASDQEELTLLEELRTINREEDYPSILLTPKECIQRLPQLREDYCVGGLFFPEELSVNPRQMIFRLHEFLKQQSRFQIRYQHPVISLQPEPDSVVVRVSGGEQFVADHVCVCNGSDFQMLLPNLFRNSDLQAVKLQMVRLSPQPEIQMPGNILTGLSIRRYESFSECPSWTEIKQNEDPDSFSKQWGVHILFKQEADGSIILGDSHEYASVAANESFSFDHQESITRYFIDQAQQIFNLTRWEMESQWSGVYCQTPDPSGIFNKVIDERIHVVTGIGGKGMTASAGYALKYLTEMFVEARSVI